MYKLKLSRRQKKELALSKWVLVVLAVVGLAVVMWLAWIRPAQHENRLHSFAACRAAGNPIQQTYPEVCLTKTGRRFVNPTQDKAHQDSLKGDALPQPPTDPDQFFLDINEWGVRVPLTKETYDMSYSYIEDGLNERMTFSFKRLVQQGICPGDVGLSLARSVTKREPPYTVDNPEPLAQIGTYYFYASFAGSPCYDTNNTTHVALVRQIAGQQSLVQAVAARIHELQPKQ